MQCEMCIVQNATECCLIRVSGLVSCPSSTVKCSGDLLVKCAEFTVSCVRKGKSCKNPKGRIVPQEPRGLGGFVT